MMNLSKQIFAYIKITRPLNVLITFLVLIVAILISQKENTSILLVLLSSLAAAFTAGAGNIINDIYDIETDKIAHPKRVLVLGEITKDQALYLYFILNIIAMMMIIYLSLILLVIVFVTIFLLFIYSAYLKRLPLIGNLMIALLTGLAFIYGGFAANNPSGAIVPAVFAFLINMNREMVKDIQDIKGDSILNYKTFPIKYGIDKSKQLIIIITFILLAFTFYPFFTQLYKIEYFIVAMIFVNPLLIFCLKILYDRSKSNSLAVVSNLLKLNMVLGLIAIYIGR
jgi:4-hydroxybenzoate polyprenyltransferase